MNRQPGRGKGPFPGEFRKRAGRKLRPALDAGAAAGSRGAVTAELAVALPAVMVVMALLLVGAMAGVSQLRLEEAAQAGARSLARGDDREIATQSIHRLAGPAAVVGITSSAGWVTVKVTANLEGPLALLFPWPLAASASARLEQPLGAGRRPELHTPQPRRAVVA